MQENAPRNSTLGPGEVFFYSIPNFTLGRGHAANYRLLEITTTYEDLYTVDLNQEADEPLRVFHNITFENNGNLPLTTGMAFVTDPVGRAVGQHKLHFTPRGDRTRLRVSGSPEVVVTQRAVTERTDAPRRERDGSFRYQTTLTVTVENYKGDAIDLRLERAIQGELLDSSVAPVANGTTETKSSYTTGNSYEWQLDVPASGKQTLTITYAYWRR